MKLKDFLVEVEEKETRKTQKEKGKRIKIEKKADLFTKKIFNFYEGNWPHKKGFINKELIKSTIMNYLKQGKTSKEILLIMKTTERNRILGLGKK